MVTFRDFVSGFRTLDLDRTHPVIVHSSLSVFGEVHGGADTVVGALLMAFDHVMAPTFTYKTMIIPEIGPEHNGIVYGSGKSTNRMAEFFRPEMKADRLMGVIPEALRRHPKARRSSHPILSFAGVNMEVALAAQTLTTPLAPLDVLRENGGWVLLMGVDHTVNTSIHNAERLAGRKQFVRWALTLEGVIECPAFPGCSQGFQAVAPRLERAARKVQLGAASMQAIPLAILAETVKAMLAENPVALLCDRVDCERCNAVRTAVY